MKKLCSLFLILLLTLFLVACGEPEPTEPLSTAEPPLSETVSTDTKTDSETESAITDASSDVTTEIEITDTEIPSDSQTSAEPSENQILLPVDDGTLKSLTHKCTVPLAVKSRIDTKNLSGAWTEELIEKLLQAPETGATIEKFSDQEIPQIYFEEFAEGLDIDRGTTWFLAKDVMFRYVKNKGLCRVETLLGEGKEVELSSELQEQLEVARLYAPTNTYLGTWKNRKLELKHVFEKEQKVEFSVEEIVKLSSEKYRIKYSLLSEEDQSVSLTLKSQQSEDNIGSFDMKTVELKANEKQTLEFEFSGWKIISFDLNIYVFVDGNTTDSHIKIVLN